MLVHATLLTLLASLVSAKDKRTFAVNNFYGKGPLTMGRMDPIVNPGTASNHVHAIQGGSNFALSMSDTTLLESKCTSSLPKNDLSNYWTPALYFQDPSTGEFTSVEMFYMKVYYFFEATDDEIKAFEPGLRIVVGDANLRTPPAGGADLVIDLADGDPQPVQWTCPRSNTNDPLYPTDSKGTEGVGIQDTGNKGAGSGFPDKNCDGYASPLRADIHFPSCYNPAAGLDNYKENMQFPSSKGTSSGKANCPEGWIHTPHLFFEVYWNTPKFADKWTPGQGKQPFVLANGDPTGYSLHADFFSGWDVETLQQIIDNCDTGNGGIDTCPGLIGGVNDPSTSCNIDNLVPETISGTLSTLPGNNKVSEWGSDVIAPVVSSATAKIGIATSSTGAVAASSTVPSSAAAPVPVTTASSEPAPSSEASSPDTTSTIEASHTYSTTTALTTLTTSIATAGASGSATATTSADLPTSTDDTCEPDATSAASPVDGWAYTGCYADNTSSRVLTGIKFANVGQHAVTNTKCITYCAARGYSVAGTEYGGQCFCGNELKGSSLLDDAKCNMACEGDAAETCGGSVSLTVYSAVNKTRRDDAAAAAAVVEKKHERITRHLHRHMHRAPVPVPAPAPSADC
ncbi:WSC domain-containing protein [Phlyctema vagabunda]|uniref:WSC domain-containing protein n=1 Tax=Phlyctema vagabunda TaxID=108571 RepID=A0ABR4PD86_9HELO